MTWYAKQARILWLQGRWEGIRKHVVLLTKRRSVQAIQSEVPSENCRLCLMSNAMMARTLGSHQEQLDGHQKCAVTTWMDALREMASLDVDQMLCVQTYQHLRVDTVVLATTVTLEILCSTDQLRAYLSHVLAIPSLQISTVPKLTVKERCPESPVSSCANQDMSHPGT